jgi:hypothetical protein
VKIANAFYKVGLSFAWPLLACSLAGATPFPALFDSTWVGFNLGTYQNARYPWGAVTGDFNMDGNPDVAAVQWSFSSGFSVVLNDGSGGFGSPVLYSSLMPSLGIVTADFDGDSIPDIAVSNTGVNFEGNSISVFFNQGNGVFGAGHRYTASLGPVGLAAGDFDGDGDMDLAVADYGFIGNGDSVSVLLNNGNGTFATRHNYYVGLKPYKLAAADINGDGHIDLAVAREEQHLSILLNNGTGGFNAPVVYNVNRGGGGDFYPNLTLADVDDDGDLDVLYVSTRTWINDDTGVIAIFHNNGNGSLSAVQYISLIRFTAGPVDIKTGDLNGDGWPDLVAAHYDGRAGDGIEVVMSNGSGGFRPAVRYPAGQTTVAAMVADVDSDGDLDLLSVDNYSMEVTVHFNSGNGHFPLPRLFTVEPISTFLDAGDINGDGSLDIVTSASGVAVGTPVSILRNQGNGVFATHSTVPLTGGGACAKLRDLDGDGDLDLLAMSPNTAPPYDFFTAMNNGNGTFGSFVRHTVGGCGFGDIDAVDLDNDGDLDVCVTEYEACQNDPNSGRRIYISLNDGNGNFSPVTAVDISANPFAITSGDYNHDGNADLATAHYGSYGANNWIEVHLGNGHGGFLSHTVYQVGQGPYDIVSADLNGDGNLDLATGNAGADGSGIETMSVLIGNGDGNFQPAVTYYGSYSPDLLGVTGMTAGDIDHDGDIDLLVSNGGSNDLSVYTNDGFGNFTFAMRYGVNSDPFSPYYADFTGDGIGDVVSCVGLPPDGGGGAVAILPGRIQEVAVDDNNIIPDKFLVIQNYPNPFNPSTIIQYTLPRTSHVKLEIYDILGRRVDELVNGEQEAGRHTAVWNGKDNSSGIYFYRLRSGNYVETKTMLLLK